MARKPVIKIRRTRYRLFFVLWLLACVPAVAQSTFFGEENVPWENNKPFVMPKGADTYSTSNLVILNDKTEFYFYAANNEKIVKHVVVKINNEAGLEAIQTYKLPESFDYAHDVCLYKQGRQSKIKIPFIRDFRLDALTARKFSRGKWNTVSFNYKYETVKWINPAGKFLNDDVPVFTFHNLAVGDVVEIYYEQQFNSDYGSNLFYFNSQYPKINCEYDFIYKVDIRVSDFAFLLPVYVPDSAISKSVTGTNEYVIKTDKIKMTHLKAINYPANSFEGKSLPHVYVDFAIYRVATGYYSTDAGKVVEFKFGRAKNFEWFFIKDTTNHYTKIYDKKFGIIRKFVATLPPVGTDSSHKTFLTALCDTFNSFRYITENQLFYNESQLYELSSADHLAKRRLVQSATGLWRDILNDNGIFYYVTNIQDRRYGEHSLYYRAHKGYETEIFAVPAGNSYLYFVPRKNGVKYFLNELPFYFEGSLACLFPRNFQESTEDKGGKTFKFIKTHKGGYNENARTENATVNVPVDSLKARMVIKESLSGQFSTVLRHVYLNEYIDSTIAPYYFKKCTQKPGASDIRIKLSSGGKEYPFRHNFNCSEQVSRQKLPELDLKGWFSFLLSKEILPETPTHDYYFDFEFSDAYNFLLQFSAPAEIKNAGSFSKKINNDLFELESGIVKNSETSYLLQVKLMVKERKVPEEKANLLMELVSALDELNGYVLQLGTL